MFYSLATALCFAVLFIVLAGSSLLSAGGLWTARRALGSMSPRTGANLLFAIRTFPLFLAVLVTLGFALPAFLRFEPRRSGEIMGFRLLLLAGLGGLVIAGIVIRALRVIWTTHRAQNQWRAHSRRLQPEGTRVPVYCSHGASPLLAVTGVFRPKIFVAHNVTQSLSAQELSAAIAHEIAHVSSLDNLKQLVLKITQLPRWLNLFRSSDIAWLNTSEMAADEGALASGASALDLSSALVKVGRLGRQAEVADLVAASHLLPVMAESSIAVRVMHLKKLLESDGQATHLQPGHGKNNHWTFASLALFVLGYAVCVNAILPWIHDALELLVR